MATRSILNDLAIERISPLPVPSMAPASDRRDVRFWCVADLRGLELLRGRYVGRASAWHAHEAFEIALIDRGTQRLRVRGTTHVAPAGSLVVINPDDAHSESGVDGRGWRTRAFFPTVRDLIDAASAITRRVRATPFFANPVIADEALVAVLGRLHRLLEKRGRSLERESLANATATALVGRYAGAAKGVREVPRNHVAVRRARELLDARACEDVSLRELAVASGVNAFHLVHLFTRDVGLPPHAYQAHLRLRHARALLALRVPIARAAIEAGFADQSHLTRRFWAAFGVTPGQYVRAIADRRTGARVKESRSGG